MQQAKVDLGSFRRRTGRGDFVNVDVTLLAFSYFSLQGFQIECKRKCSNSIVLPLEKRSKFHFMIITNFPSATDLYNLDGVGVGVDQELDLRGPLLSLSYEKFLKTIVYIGNIAVREAMAVCAYLW